MYFFLVYPQYITISTSPNLRRGNLIPPTCPDFPIPLLFIVESQQKGKRAKSFQHRVQHGFNTQNLCQGGRPCTAHLTTYPWNIVTFVWSHSILDVPFVIPGADSVIGTPFRDKGKRGRLIIPFHSFEYSHICLASLQISHRTYPIYPWWQLGVLNWDHIVTIRWCLYMKFWNQITP